ncbi:aspartokinase [Bacteroidia bacterium]|nr:aspartokinase [Bacteroidia bacterium]
MKIFKFGGASTANATEIKNISNIIKQYSDTPLVVVVSAMNKTTNALEDLLNANRSDLDFMPFYNKIRDFHIEVLNELFEDKSHPVYSEVESLFFTLMNTFKLSNEDYDYQYDQMVSIGELLSSKIVYNYLNYIGVNSKWLDVRKCISTDSNFREGNVNWIKTEKKVNELVEEFCEENTTSSIVLITQGFMGSDDKNRTVTLGREGSDFTGAIFAHCLEAESLTIWKDVPGFLNADPRYFLETHKINAMSYKEAIELAYYGANVIHPKTIKPLQNKKIPLFVKSFKDIGTEGTVINEVGAKNDKITYYICKPNQMLITISPKDFSFIAEQNLSYIFFVFADNNMKINLMQNSALSFTVCVDKNSQRIDDVLEALSNKFELKYNDNLQLVTLRNFSDEVLRKILSNNVKILLEQKNRTTAQFVMQGFL